MIDKGARIRRIMYDRAETIADQIESGGQSGWRAPGAMAAPLNRRSVCIRAET